MVICLLYFRGQRTMINLGVVFLQWMEHSDKVRRLAVPISRSLKMSRVKALSVRR